MFTHPCYMTMATNNVTKALFQLQKYLDRPSLTAQFVSVWPCYPVFNYDKRNTLTPDLYAKGVTYSGSFNVNVLDIKKTLPTALILVYFEIITTTVIPVLPPGMWVPIWEERGEYGSYGHRHVAEGFDGEDAYHMLVLYRGGFIILPPAIMLTNSDVTRIKQTTDWWHGSFYTFSMYSSTADVGGITHISGSGVKETIKTATTLDQAFSTTKITDIFSDPFLNTLLFGAGYIDGVWVKGQIYQQDQPFVVDIKNWYPPPTEDQIYSMPFWSAVRNPNVSYDELWLTYPGAMPTVCGTVYQIRELKKIREEMEAYRAGNTPNYENIEQIADILATPGWVRDDILKQYPREAMIYARGIEIWSGQLQTEKNADVRRILTRLKAGERLEKVLEDIPNLDIMSLDLTHYDFLMKTGIHLA